MEPENILDAEVLQLQEKKRPTVITVLCVLGFVGAAFAILLIFSSKAAQIGKWYPPFLALSTINGIACMIGLWFMKRWAVYLYTGFFLLTQIILLVFGVWSFASLIIPLAFIAILLNFIKKMD